MSHQHASQHAARRFRAALRAAVGVAGFFACLGVHAADAAPAQAGAATRADIEQQRKQLQAELARQEAACYQRFAVNDCLLAARAAARASDNLLWRQELELDEAERRERAAQRSRSIEERGVAPPPVPPSAHPADPSQAAQREREAQERAQSAQQRRAEHTAQQRQREQEQAQRLEDARQRHEERERKANERRERYQKQLQDDAAQGRVPARPLPPAPGEQQ